MGAITWNRPWRYLLALAMALSVVAGCQDNGPDNDADEQGQNKAAHDLAIAEIHKLGANIDIDDTIPGKAGVKLDLRKTEITDGGLQRVVALSPILELYLSDTKITDAGLAHLSGLKPLQRLYLNDTSVTDAGLANLRGLTNLQVLTVGGTKVTAAGVKNLQKSLPKLKVLR